MSSKVAWSTNPFKKKNLGMWVSGRTLAKHIQHLEFHPLNHIILINANEGQQEVTHNPLTQG